MARYDVVVIGAGLGGLTAAAILARAGRKVLIVERSNSVGGAASSYKVGDLFVEGSLHETSDPRDTRDPKHEVLTRAGILDAVTWCRSETFYEVRGGPVGRALQLPASFAGAREALIRRFPESRDGVERLLRDIEHGPTEPEGSLSLLQKLDSVFGGNEAAKCVAAANLAYYHDDPATLAWPHFATSQAHYLRSGPSFVNGGSQRLSSALARAVRTAGGTALLRRNVTAIMPGANGHIITHTAKDGSDPQQVEAARVISNAAPDMVADMLPDDAAATVRAHYAGLPRSISLFALTLGLSRPPREFGITSYSTHLLPPWMQRLADYPRGSTVMAGEPGNAMPPLAIADYAAIDSGIPTPPHVLSIFGPDRLANWDASDMDRYREKRARWRDAIVRYLDKHYPGLADAVTASSFNTALSTKQYLGAPDGAVYGFAPDPATLRDPRRSPRTPIEGLYLSSAYANVGGYTGVIVAGARCADMILRT
ncbi:MAG TPA: NAD(P)/FAD-dependent oxidoreductase [Nitrobacter sp.]|nr:NAD(P)/FAD-dependent oxidoreductase [Nitrobacter sp.]